MQHKQETAREYLRRIASNMDLEPCSLIDQLPTIASIVEYFELWDTYGADFLEGIHEAIAEGDDPAPLEAFVAKYKLGADVWLPDPIESQAS